MNNTALTQIWVYLAASPLFGLTVTLVAYQIAHHVYARSGRNPLLNPVVTAVLLLIGLLLLTGISYQDYFAGAQFVHFLLGPATVALAIPLYRQFARLRQLWLPVLVALVLGVSIGGLSAVLIAGILGADSQTLLSLAPKSVTAPVAMGIAERIGGLPSLTAVLVVSTGVIGAVFGTKLFDWMGIQDDSVRGIAMGVAAHGIGTARAFQVSTEMGAFSGLAMALSAFLASVILPWIVSWVQ
ncbi:MAG TPA: LrgB family protein [Thiolinea sp.]|nr:LrgB family protein [Thiolinea sp.]